MVAAAVRSKAVILLFVTCILVCDIVFCTIYFCIGFFFCSVILCILSSLAIILPRKRELIVYFNCVVCVMCSFLMMPCVGLQSVIVAFPGLAYFFVETLFLKIY